MIKFLIFLANLERKVKTAEKKASSKEASWRPRSIYDATVGQYQLIKKRAEQKPLPEPPKERRGLYDMVKGFVENAYANTVGYPLSLYQNYKTVKEIRKNPDVKKRVHVIVPGFFQNIGSHYKLGRQLREQGDLHYHVHAGHGIATMKPLEEKANKFYQKMDYLRQKTGLSEKDFQKIPKTYRGHSSGADLGYYLAGDERIKKYGIDKVIGVAGTGGGLEMKTPAQKLFAKAFPQLKAEDPRYSKHARKNIVNLNEKRPKVPVYSIYGSNDELVPRHKIIPYQHAVNEAIIYHPQAGHFGTSGQNYMINKAILELDKLQEKHHRYKTIKYVIADKAA